MKTRVLLFAAIFCIAFSSMATTHTVTVANFVFTPASIPDVHLGDTILWTFLSGSHTTSSTTIPSGAASWDHAISSSSTSFTYVPAVAGTYNYQCNIHGAGMSASFTVINGTQIGAVKEAVTTIIYPNPVANALHIRFRTAAPATVTLTDMAGKQLIVKKYNSVSVADLDLRDVPAGNYVFRSVQGSDVYSQQLVVKH